MSGIKKRKLNSNDIDPKVYELFDEYIHSQISRRQFLKRAGQYAVAGITANLMLDFLAPNYAQAIQIQPDDSRLNSEYIDYASPKGAGKMKALLSREKNATNKLPGIIVVHENRGLNPYIEDVGRRGAVEGFITIAPDALTPFGGYPGNDDDGRALQRKRDRDEMLEDFIAAFDYLYDHPECNGCIGVVGFCFGGSISNKMSARVKNLKAAAPFYGGQLSAEDTKKINAPLQLHYAELDKRVNAGWPEYEKALKENNKEYTAYMYAGAKHGFHNDTTPRFDKESAELAWSRTIKFFKEKLVM